MSLALVVTRQRSAVIVSDGAVVEVHRDGTTRRGGSSDYPKFAAFPGGLAIAGTNDAWMMEQMLSVAGRFFAHTCAPAFDDLVGFMAKTVPVLRQKVDQRALRFPIEERHKYANLALVGFDANADRARIVLFSCDDPSCTPVERTFVALGTDSHVAGPLLRVAFHQASWGVMPSVMRGIVGRIADGHDVIGGNVYTCELGPDGTAKVECRRRGATAVRQYLVA
jgi:hypothetical protein